MFQDDVGNRLMNDLDTLPQIDIRQLRYFVTVAELGSMRMASIAIGVQQSSISRGIRDLEDELGVSLFHRHSGGVTLTDAGSQFLRRVKRGLRTIVRGTQDAGKLGRGERGRAAIGVFSSLASGFLPLLIREFSEAHPEVHLDFVDGNPEDHKAEIRRFRIDVAFLTGTGPHPECDITRLWTERVFVVLPASHPLADRRDIDWVDLSSSMFIVSDVAPGQEIEDYLIKRLADLSYRPTIDVQSVGRDNLLLLVALGKGLTLTSESTTATRYPGIVYRPIRNEILPFSAVWSRQNTNPVLRRLLSTARRIAGEFGRDADMCSHYDASRQTQPAGPGQTQQPARK